MSHSILEITIGDIIKESSLDSHTSQQTKQKLEIIGVDNAGDLFENFDKVDININIINELREIAYNEYYKLNNKPSLFSSKIFVEFTPIMQVEKLKNARKRLAFAKLSQERLSLNSLLNDINIDLLNKIGEILLEFLNFRYFPKKIKKLAAVNVEKTIKRRNLRINTSREVKLRRTGNIKVGVEEDKILNHRQ